MFAVGLLLSTDGTADDLVQVPSLLFQGSLLLGSLCKSVLGFEAARGATVGIHPLVIAGWCGLTTTALNLLPVGCVDGGRAMQASFGKFPLNLSGLATYLCLGLGLLGGNLALPWGLYVLIVQRNQEKPALNDVTDVGIARQALFVAAVLASAAVLLPVLPSPDEFML
eukprot:TRINITY_DN4219_c0_g4_i1.p1 TRINITY_DN4219_c0_g4~~TRINITY_DN4219_c0_g4_i1.p1  ORF type:complete len:175 (+),score=29.74 TRINITY_DN4219_c0_g4_i1:24-527(+)